MRVSNAMKTFKVSCLQIQCINVKDLSAVKVNKNRPGKFSNDMTMAFLMLQDIKKNRAALIRKIKHRKKEAITPEKSQKICVYVQWVYCPCTKFQEITGMVLSPPKD